MTKIIPIVSLELPELTPYRTLRLSTEHFREGIFIAEGEKVVMRLLESGLELISVLIAPEWLEKYRESFEIRPENLTVYLGNKELLEKIVGFNLHQGIMALGKIPEPASIETALLNSGSPRLMIAIDGLTNSENIGVLVRNSVAFGAQAILVGETSSSPYLRRAVRNSMGTVFKIPVVHCDSLVEMLKKLRAIKFKVYAAHPHTEKLINEMDFTGDCCLVFGSEGSGISEKVISACDAEVAISMNSGVDSLNVASASAVFLYEVNRQRTKSQ